MIINFILSVLLLILGCTFSAGVLLFGVKFCTDSEKLPDDITHRGIISHLIKDYPFWIWIIVFLVFQPAIVHIINVWTPAVWTGCKWIPGVSDFIGFITVVFFFVIYYITDDSGRLKLSKKI